MTEVVPGSATTVPGVSDQVWRRLRRFAETTPGRLGAALVGLVLLSVLTGVSGVIAVQGKSNTLDDLAQRQEPVSAAAQQIYRSLSDADATAASAFLSGGVEPADLRKRYEVDIAQAGAALAVAASDTEVASGSDTQLNQLSTQLPVYTGLVETARTNNRQGYPAGAAYLREASGLMRSQLLPAAKQLYQADTQRLESGQDDATALPWLTGVLVLALVVALVLTQRYLTRKTNRVFNRGLVVATVAVAVAVVWAGVALVISAIQLGDAKSDGSQQVDNLVDARIAALNCRADETLTLVARGDGKVYEDEFKALAVELAGTDGRGGLLGQAAATASADAGGPVHDAGRTTAAWFAAHEQIRQLDDSGSYDKAVDNAIGTGQDSAGTLFTALDNDLEKAIDAGRTQFLDHTRAAADALFGLVVGIAVLALVAAASASFGIWQRLREYR